MRRITKLRKYSAGHDEKYYIKTIKWLFTCNNIIDLLIVRINSKYLLLSQKLKKSENSSKIFFFE